MDSTARIAHRLKLRDLRVLDAVVRWGSMARAANHLNVTQPAVSKTISELERMLGVRLLDRTSQGVEPTVYGRAILKRGVAIFDEVQQGVKEIEYLADRTAGEVRIGCGEPMAAGLVPAIIERIGRRYPRIVCHVVQTTSTEQEIRELRERSFDLMLTRISEPNVDADMHADILFEERVYVVAGKRSKWARRRRVELAELVDEPWILTPPNTLTASLVEEAFRAKHLEMPLTSVVTLSVHVRNSLLPTGRYLTVLPGSVLRYSAMGPSFRALPVDFPAKPRLVAVVRLKNRTLNPVAQLVIDCARDVAKPMAKKTR
jgi:DNA-binding transcriptional LysR family regulator